MYDISSVKLFLEASETKNLPYTDIVDLIAEDKDYPIQKMMPAIEHLPDPVTP